eukprot:CAMPEP_0170587950 /NCGR_PEP_ID=MMETSP0224-20130122/10563_1 /TAXON_ID=285029 /ORGANISM="Togula jolla, Strain CCCM 725" /LENGTH=135 /DNA_ID=CAMNT_0010911621 /DNA_START=627 /DNA_END=1034 /DNA_ORIENTATION=+
MCASVCASRTDSRTRSRMHIPGVLIIVVPAAVEVLFLSIVQVFRHTVTPLDFVPGYLRLAWSWTGALGPRSTKRFAPSSTCVHHCPRGRGRRRCAGAAWHSDVVAARSDHCDGGVLLAWSGGWRDRVGHVGRGHM